MRPVLFLALVATAANAQLSSLKGHDADAPADITADRIELQDRANRAIFVGKVHVVQGDMTMDAARMTVAYRRAPTPGADPEIQRIDASGGVTVVDPSEKAQGSFGIYDLDKRLITLIGAVTLTRGTNVVHGTRLVIDLNTGRSTVDGSAVGGPSTAASGGRVTGHFTVPKRSTAAPAPGTSPK
jgi:lipopolysaccharide export system protein LptA